MHSEVYFWHERMKWVSFLSVFWQDLQNLLSLSKGGLKRLLFSIATKRSLIRRNFERIL